MKITNKRAKYRYGCKERYLICEFKGQENKRKIFCKMVLSIAAIERFISEYKDLIILRSLRFNSGVVTLDEGWSIINTNNMTEYELSVVDNYNDMDDEATVASIIRNKSIGN